MSPAIPLTKFNQPADDLAKLKNKSSVHGVHKVTLNLRKSSQHLIFEMNMFQMTHMAIAAYLKGISMYRRNSIFPFEISFFVLEILTFL